MLHILYTEEEGGDFHFIAKNNDEETQAFYDEVVKTGYLIHSIGDRVIKVAPAYICLSTETDGYDFVLKRRRIGTTLLDEEPTIPEYKDPMAEVGQALENAIEKPEEEVKSDQ